MTASTINALQGKGSEMNTIEKSKKLTKYTAEHPAFAQTVRIYGRNVKRPGRKARKIIALATLSGTITK